MRQQSNAKILILIASFVGATIFVLCCVVVAIAIRSKQSEFRLPYPAGRDLAEARAKYPTRLSIEMAAPQDYREETPPPGVLEVNYPSENLQLKAWVSEDPGDGRRRPAVVYLHGGFSFAGVDWNDGQPFIDAGYVLMMPMLRGENGNPGSFEDQYGEVNDAIAAGQYVSELSYVDPEKIVVVGHSAGARLTLLAAMMPSKFKAAAAYSGTPNYEDWLASEWGDLAPFDKSNLEERRVRNPAAFIESIQCPLYLFIEPSHPDVASNRMFVKRAKELGKSSEFYQMPGNHSTMVAPSVKKSIELFRQHLGSN